jgi:signal peptidase I
VRYGAALLSLVFPGVGHVFAGWTKRGVVFALAALLWNLLYHASPYGAALLPRLVTPPLVLLCIAIGLLLALGAALDAFRLARRSRPPRLPPVPRWLLYAAFIVVPALPGLAAPIGWAQYTIPSGSMVPTLRVGDHVLAIDGYYGHFPAQRGDLVAFKAHGVLLIKRVIGLPGDRVEMNGGNLVINGMPAPLEPLAPMKDALPECRSGLFPRFREELPGGVRHTILRDCGPGALRETEPLEVPAGHYFMLGDNRDDSDDSRDPESAGGIGFVAADAFVSRAMFVAYSLDGRRRSLGLPFAVRWARVALKLD